LVVSKYRKENSATRELYEKKNCMRKKEDCQPDKPDNAFRDHSKGVNTANKSHKIEAE